ncbi:hypothetical protein Glove_606g128 [Diversispora epigaea]|uniref:Uncharacterized protein n=1 Tax=Diversispora epigaea TaxID=1348612 RepID=A0A397GB07_9GLOM|nr:hypothetical protein Glove_606g128 [Diversispora epigaea]
MHQVKCRFYFHIQLKKLLYDITPDALEEVPFELESITNVFFINLCGLSQKRVRNSSKYRPTLLRCPALCPAITSIFRFTSARRRPDSPYICWQGCCENIIYETGRVIVKWGYRDFDFVKDEDKCKCPNCYNYVKLITCGFVNTKWKYEGVIKKLGSPSVDVSSDWKFTGDDIRT